MSGLATKRNVLCNGIDTDQTHTLQSRQTIFCKVILRIIEVDWTDRSQGENINTVQGLYRLRTRLMRYYSPSARGRNVKVKMKEAYVPKDAQQWVTNRTRRSSSQRLVKKVILRHSLSRSMKVRGITIISRTDQTSSQRTDQTKHGMSSQETNTARHILHQYPCSHAQTNIQKWPNKLATAQPQADLQLAHSLEWWSKPGFPIVREAQTSNLTSPEPKIRGSPFAMGTFHKCTA